MAMLNVLIKRIMNTFTPHFYSFEDFKNQLSVYNRIYNNFPMLPLIWKYTSDYIKAFIAIGEVF